MPPTIISSNASNWVDRGEPPNATLRRILAHHLQRFDPADEAFLEEHANTILGMVAADATEVHIAAYLIALRRDAADTERDGRTARMVAIGLWHAAKAALVRDFAERVLQGDVPANEPTPDSFSHWIASRLLTPEELAKFESSE